MGSSKQGLDSTIQGTVANYLELEKLTPKESTDLRNRIQNLCKVIQELKAKQAPATIITNQLILF